MAVLGNNLPPPQSPFVDPKTGVLSNDGYQFLMNLLNQANQAIPTVSTNTGIEATGGSQATATPLTATFNEVEAGVGGVLLAALQQGQSQTVFNNTGGTINVYPPVDAQIDNIGVDGPFGLTAGTKRTFDFFSTTQIS